MAQKTLAQIADEQHAWIESVGWAGNRTNLENFGRIGAEIGELSNECRNENLGDGFEDELADVILATLTAIKESDANDLLLDMPINDLAEKYSNGGWPASSISIQPTMLAKISYGFLLVGAAIEMCEDKKPDRIKSCTIDILEYFLALAHKAGININNAIIEKMAKNQLKGNRGRKK